MKRPLAFLVPSLLSFVVGLGLVSSGIAACSAREEQAPSLVDASVRRDSAPVEEAEGGMPPPPQYPPRPTCEKYCDLVMSNCTGESAQYGSLEDCLAFCAHVPLAQPTHDDDEREAASVACRQYWADSPARTDPKAYCLAAGPFGGNTCGDRCTAFCDVALSACDPDGGVGAPYADLPECASACATFSYRDAGVDGGGEGPDGPATGDTLNCRLFWLRTATRDAQACSALRPTSKPCTE